MSQTVHISGKNDEIADSLSRIFLNDKYKHCVYELLSKPVWVQVPASALEVNWVIISGVSQQIQTLSAKARLNSVYVPSTNKAYDSKFRIFTAFCCFASVNISQISIQVILAFMEFLTFNKVSHSGIANYLSAVKTKLSNFGLNTVPFKDNRIKVYNKAIMRYAPFKPNIQAIIDTNMLHKLANHCDNMYLGIIFKAAILTSFFSFLKNIKPSPSFYIYL